MLCHANVSIGLEFNIAQSRNNLKLVLELSVKFDQSMLKWHSHHTTSLSQGLNKAIDKDMEVFKLVQG
jgi:hypothetical protein